ncbi:MAG: methyltransferase family protein [Candidatus Hodarchaeales archaeon]|jgi:protein-S-isoprenylcysteine O-methyltransferase Ste14
MMSIERHHVKGLLAGVLVIGFATIISIILTVMLREAVGREIVYAFLFPIDIGIPVPFRLCGILILVAGIILVIWANFTLLVIGKIGFTAREPFHVPSTLVVVGPYKFSRNPIYLAVILLALGAGMLMDSLTVILISIALFFIFRIWFISWEERKLEEAFGEKYLEFKRRVRRWF